MRIEFLKTAPDRSGRYAVRFDDGSTLRLYRQSIEDFGLYTGMELTETEYAKLLKSASEVSAKMRAVRIVSAANVSKKELQSRLVRKGEDPLEAEKAVAWLSDMKVLDDSQTAEALVRSCIAKGYGINRAKQVLYEKRIPRSCGSMLWRITRTRKKRSGIFSGPAWRETRTPKQEKRPSMPFFAGVTATVPSGRR